MHQGPQPDEYWKKHLTSAEYAALREGAREEANTGRYVNATATGRYECAGCGAQLFRSSDKVAGTSGYATFEIHGDSTALAYNQSYTSTGEGQRTALCATCKSVIGVPSAMGVRTGDDLAEGSSERRIIHANSTSIRLVKDVTPKNYPVAFAGMLVVLLVVGALVWNWVGDLASVATDGSGGQVVMLLEGEEVSAQLVRLDDLDGTAPAEFLSQDLLFIILSSKRNAPELRLPNQKLDVVWLDSLRQVTLGQRELVLGAEGTLEPPQDAAFVIIARGGELPVRMFNPGYEIYFVDRSILY